ncbi:hypothetical protein FCM35_KLT13885 [Carex littledalei]|uniref:Uncharacterized protein n=1 Tax=Carex littledalei TaxID=544730 RepID=A0A833QFJ5_9POAL|nr:hypothetical protein FCM35_KLT13885 [Carex littledalei]
MHLNQPPLLFSASYNYPPAPHSLGLSTPHSKTFRRPLSLKRENGVSQKGSQTIVKDRSSWVITAYLASDGWGPHHLLSSSSYSLEVEISGRNLLLEKNRSPAPHGGRGALPSAGGSPSDLLFLAGGGFFYLLIPSS